MFNGDDPWGFTLDFRDNNPYPGGDWPAYQQIVDNRAVGAPVAYQTLTGDALHTYRAVFDPVTYTGVPDRPSFIPGRLYKDGLQIGNVTMVTVSGDGDNRLDLGDWVTPHADVIGAEWDYVAWRLGAYDPAVPVLYNRGDVTGEGFVGADDLVEILTNWGDSGVVPWEDGDIAPYGDGSNPGDDFIGADDYVEVLTYWGTDYTGAEPTPEPATLLLLLGGLGVLARRR